MSIMNSGEFFVESGSISAEQLNEAISTRKDFAKILLGQVLVRLTLVDQIMLDNALAEQIREVSQTGLVHRRMLGEVLVDLKFISEEQLGFALDEQRRLRHLNLGNILVEMEILTIRQLDALIAGQMKALTISVA